MEKLNIVNWFEPFEIDVFVDSLELDGLFVLVELLVPLFDSTGVFFRVGTPVCHTETRMGEPGVPSDDDHTEDSCGCQEEPTSDEFLFTLLYVLLGVVVLVETSLEERR